MEIKVLGVCGSPIKGGNTEVFLSEALKTAEALGSVTTDLISLAGKQIADCRHCNWCLTKQEEGRFCAIKDDMLDMYPMVLQADVLLTATPAYTGRLSGYTATFLDRFRCLVLGKHYKGVLGHKVGGAFAVAWFRNAGLETTLLSIISSFLMWGMVVVSPGEGGCQFGAAAVSTEGGSGKFDPKDRLGVLKDELGMKSARVLARRCIQTTRTLKAGREALREGT